MTTNAPVSTRPTVVLPPEEQARLNKLAELADSERPLVAERMRRVDRAAAEATFSGELRRAIHHGPFDLAVLEQRTRIEASRLADFLEGSAELSSSEIDALIRELGLQLVHPVPLATAKSRT